MFCGAVAAALTLQPNAAASPSAAFMVMMKACGSWPQIAPGQNLELAVGRALQLLNLMAKYLPSAGALCKVFHCQSANLLFCGSTIEILWLPGMPAN